MKRLFFYRTLALLAIFLSCAFAWEMGAFMHIDNAIAEKRMSAKSHAASGKIALLEIDNKSLTSIGVWPWNRSIYADIIKKSFEAGAEELAFDIDFSSHSTDRADSKFAKALEEASGPVTLAVFQQYSTSEIADTRLQTNRPIDKLADVAWLATVNVIADADGLVRSIPLGQQTDGELVPSLTSVLGGVQDITASTHLINYDIDPETIPTYSIIDLLEGSLPADVLKNRKVLIGAGAAELRDTMAVPVYGVLSGPKLQILAAENLIQNTSLHEISQRWLYYAAGLGCLPIFLFFMVRHVKNITRILGLLLLSACVELVGYWLYSDYHLLLQTAMIQIFLISSGIILMITEISFKSLMLNLSHKHNKSISAFLETIIEDNLSGIIIVSEENRIIGISRHAIEMLSSLGYEPARNDKYTEVLPWEFGHKIQQCLKDGENCHIPDALQIEKIERHGETRYFEFTITPSSFMQGNDDEETSNRVATLLFHDVTETQLKQIHLEYLADHDPVTDLLNINGFTNEVEALVTSKAARRASIFVCQGRRLEKVYQTLGEDYHDQLLHKMGEALSALDAFDVVGNVDHKKFMLCKLDCSPRDHADLIARIRECLETPFSVRGHNIIVNGHIGIATFYSDDEQVTRTIDDAVLALSDAIATGETFRHYTAKLKQEADKSRALEGEIIGALERNEFELRYQPQTDLATGETIGCEALIRWNHKEFGLIRPDLFIPLLEETGKIVDIGRWIIRTACKDAENWPKPVTVAVNVSAVQF